MRVRHQLQRDVEARLDDRYPHAAKHEITRVLQLFVNQLFVPARLAHPALPPLEALARFIEDGASATSDGDLERHVQILTQHVPLLSGFARDILDALFIAAAREWVCEDADRRDPLS